MRIFCFALALILPILLCVDVYASGDFAGVNMVYPVYEYDAATQILTVGIKYAGRELSAIGVCVVYDNEILEYIIKYSKTCDTSHKSKCAINRIKNQLHCSVFNHDVSPFV